MPTALSYREQIMLTIRDRTRILFHGPVRAVTSLNAKGRFDVLPEHANFISVIRDYIIIHTVDRKEQRLTITRGVIKVSGNTVSIYLGLSPIPAAK